MKRFQFRLDRLQRLRDRTRQERRLSLAEATQYQQRIENQIAQLDEVRGQELLERRQRLAATTVSIEEVIRGQSFDAMLHRFAQQLGQQLEQVRGVVEQRRLQLQEAEKGVRVLEKLREKMEDRYDDQVESNERQLLDELANVGEQRRRNT